MKKEENDSIPHMLQSYAIISYGSTSGPLKNSILAPQRGQLV